MNTRCILQYIKNQISNIEKLGVENINNQHLVEQIYEQLDLLEQDISQSKKKAIDEDYIRLLCRCCPD